MGFIPPNDTNAKHWTGVALLAVRVAGGVAAMGCFFAGLWSVWGDPGRGVSLMGLGIFLGVVFGRYPGGAAGLSRKKTDAG
jgi:hypothetical protein